MKGGIGTITMLEEGKGREGKRRPSKKEAQSHIWLSGFDITCAKQKGRNRRRGALNRTWPQLTTQKVGMQSSCAGHRVHVKSRHFALERNKVHGLVVDGPHSSSASCSGGDPSRLYLNQFMAIGRKGSPGHQAYGT